MEGKTKNISHDHLIAISKRWGIGLEWLISGKGRKQPVAEIYQIQEERVASHRMEADSIVAIPRYRIALAAGAGNLVLNEEADSHLHFQGSWLRKKRLPVTKLKALDVHGDSMEPRISSGDVVLINTGDTKIKDDRIYAIRYGEDVKIKRLSVRYDGAVVLTSDNPHAKGPTEEVVQQHDLNQLQIIGLAVWVGGELH